MSVSRGIARSAVVAAVLAWVAGAVAQPAQQTQRAQQTQQAQQPQAAQQPPPQAQPAARPVYPQVTVARDNEPWTPSRLDALNPALPTLFLAGDSTADRGPDAWHRGWGAVLGDYFDTTRINVVNRARGGRSFRSFVREGLWDELVAAVKPGDYVLIQFGHNDGGDIDNPNGRPDLPGLGDETAVVTRPDGTQETVLTFGAYARKYIADVRAKGGTPILLSVTATSRWNDAGFVLQPGETPHWMYEGIRQIAREHNVAFLDHQAAISDRYVALGETVTRSFFAADWVHTTTAGAIVNAEAFIGVLRGASGLPLVDYLNDKGRAIPAWSAAASVSAPAADRRAAPRVGPLHDGFNPNLPTLWLIGDSTVKEGRDDGEPIQTYGWYLRRYIREARAQGATPIVASLVPRNAWRDGKVVRGQDTSYVRWSREAAEQEGAFWINLNHIVSETMDELGEDFAVGALFRPDDPTHTITLGAQLNAMSVVRGLKALGPSLPLVEFLLPAAEALEPARDDLVVAGQVTSPPRAASTPTTPGD